MRRTYFTLAILLILFPANLSSSVPRIWLQTLFSSLKERPGDLQESRPKTPAFRGSYSGAKTVEQGAGGHASAPGPPSPQLSSLDDLREMDEPIGVSFEERKIINLRTSCGGPAKDHILESGGSGVALLDYDNDGRLDIFFVNAFELSPSKERVPHRNALFRNLGNWKFEDVSKKAGVEVAAWGNGVCAGDYNNDGHLDLYVTNWGANSLLRNNGDGTFTDAASEAGVNDSGWSTGCTFFDADADGDLDLYVAHYVKSTWADVVQARRTRVWRGGPKVMEGPVGLPGERDVLYRNEGNGKFTEVTDAAGVTDVDAGYGFGVLATDYDDDGNIDLYVVNDSNPNFLFHNLGKGRFQEVGLTAGVALSGDGRAQAGMGVDSGDYDGDALLDIVVTNFAHDTNTIYRNLGRGQFEDASQGSGLYSRTFKRLGWGVALLDADLDSDLDLFFANGHIYPQVDEVASLEETFRQKNQLLLNDKGRFRDVSEQAGAGLQIEKSSRGLAMGDLDNDGDLDLVITNMDEVPTVLENTLKTKNHWIALSLRKQGANRFCLGAKVTISSNGGKQVREIRSGGSYLCQNDLRAFFGLGSFSGPVDVEVKMPGNKRWEWNGLRADRFVDLLLEE